MDILTEPLRNFGRLKRADREAKARELLRMVELPEDLSTGIPQHVWRTAAAHRHCQGAGAGTKSLVCDRPPAPWMCPFRRPSSSSWFGCSREKQISIVFICHDLALVQSFSHQIAVMYLGHVVEVIPGEQVARGALHPYTQALLNALFSIHMEQEKKIEHQGEAPSPWTFPGLPLQNQCPHCGERCRREKTAAGGGRSGSPGGVSWWQSEKRRGGAA